MRWVLGGLAVIAAIILWITLGPASALFRLPSNMLPDISGPMDDAFRYASRELTLFGVKFATMTRGLGTLLSQPFVLIKGALGSGFTIYHEAGGKTEIPAIPWSVTVLAFSLIAYRFGGAILATGTAMTFLWFLAFGLWESAMVTLALVLVSVVLAVIFGLLLGLWGYRSPRVHRALEPLYDIMQTLPLFSYLVPMILFFGFGPIASLAATVIYALPPMARITTQAMQDVHKSVKEFGEIAGCSRRQMTWMVLVPAARKALLLGVNQVIMLSLSVVVIASLIGAGGLGGDVLKALKSVRIGDAVVVGFALTFMAMVMDRMSFAFAMQRPKSPQERPSWVKRNWVLIAVLVGGGMLALLSLAMPALAIWPKTWTLDAGSFFNDLVRWISTRFQSELNGLRDVSILYILKPTKLALLSMPWASFTLLVSALGLLLGGWRLAVLAGAIMTAIAFLGYWNKAMLSLYLVVLAVISATLIGFFLGVWGGQRRLVGKVLIAVVDTLQTMPMFVYLIPVVMLFSIGDFPSFLAILIYVVSPAIRYTIVGISGVKPTLIESAQMSGSTPRQTLWLVKVPLALPTILLGLNQTIMLAFGMLVITSLIGTRGLEEVALTSIAWVSAGEGLLSGLSIAGMAILFDRFVRAANQRVAYQLGLPIPR